MTVKASLLRSAITSARTSLHGQLVARSAACLAVAGSLAFAFGNGEAAAQADPAGEVRALQAKVEQLSARVTALDAMLARQGRTVTVSGSGSDRDLILRVVPGLATGISLDRRDAVLRFDRITLAADEIALDAKRTISLKAAAISLNGQVNANGQTDVIVKGNAVRNN